MANSNKPGGGESEPGAQQRDNDGLVPEADEIMGARDDARDPAAVEAELRRELEETRQAMLRALADAENVRRRAQRDVADAKQYAVTGFARDLLNVSDNFRRALSAAEGARYDELPPDLKGLIDGVRMTERELNAAFERHGVKVVDPVGERFDPNVHQAMFEVEQTDVPAGTVVQVVQTGSMIGERVLRPAMVGVSKGGPKRSDEAGAQRQGAGGAGGTQRPAESAEASASSGQDGAGTNG